MRPTVMLVVGVRGIPVAHLCGSLDGWADVVVATTRETLSRRPDGPDIARRDGVLVSEGQRGLVASAVRYASHSRVDGVVTVSEDVITPTAQIAAQIDLPGLPPAAMPALCDKIEQRRALRAAGVPVPTFARVTSADPVEVERALEVVDLPAVLKPTRASGGALTYPCPTPQRVREALGEAFSQRAGARGAVAADSTYVLESLLVGVPRHPVRGFAPYVSVETLAENGTYHHLAVTDRFPLAPPALETGMMLPSCLADADQDEVRDTASVALSALDFTHGVAHTEVMLTADGPRVIEVNARVGGALPYLFPMVGSVDVVEQAARLALGLPVAQRADFTGHAVFLGPRHRIGATLEAVDGVADLMALPGVQAAMPVEVARSGRRVIGFDNSLIAAVLATVPDPAAAVALWRRVMNTVRPRYIEPADAPETVSAAALSVPPQSGSSRLSQELS